ncbi:hypothetical protein GCM10010387_29510 [Streptomyces inusitatus]|uniref:Uncharacterized protein n=1 Tax=Streptomyces inusitatus TaxID=68221 RepID=A0A918Q4F7_9ACTN|nr:hypothetical protein [Streptomyces inusitatus]GGZ33458.1 hypothetical protein GCM10010387_29510 [Streptomyces inusitatus]
MVLTPRAYAALVIDDAAGLLAPSGPRRRVAPEDRFDASLAPVLEGVDWLAGALSTDSVNDPLFYAHDLSLEITSYLYAAGAAHDSWREWSSLTSWGSALRGDVFEAAAYAVLGGDWEHLRAFPPPSGPQPPSRTVVWQLALGSGAPLDTEANPDELEKTWLSLLASIPLREHERTEAALKTLVDFWTLEDEQWDLFEPHGYPCFDPHVCAVVALAYRHGYRPRALTDDARRFLDPGLALRLPEA